MFCDLSCLAGTPPTKNRKTVFPDIKEGCRDVPDDSLFSLIPRDIVCGIFMRCTRRIQMPQHSLGFL